MNPFIQLRSACYLLVLVAVCAIPFALAQRNATSQSVARHANVSEGSVRLGNTLPAATIVVTNTNDSGPGSLRNALAIARVGDTIDATGVSGTILLTSGALQITHNVSITGPGAGNLAINGNATSDVFEMEGFFPLVFEMEGFFALSTGVTISGFTITNGVVGISSVNVGGLFSRSQTLTITNCTVSGNIGVGISNNATPASFGSFASVTLTITNSTVSGNSGGGISNIAAAGEQEGPTLS